MAARSKARQRAARSKPRGRHRHGDLRRALIDAARVLVEREGRQALRRRAAARMAGGSQAAPHRHFPDTEALMADRLGRPAAPLVSVAPRVPPTVAAAVARLLDEEPEDRPSSSIHALELLQGEAGAEHRALVLPRLGGAGPVRRVLAAARAGRPAIRPSPGPRWSSGRATPVRPARTTASRS